MTSIVFRINISALVYRFITYDAIYIPLNTEHKYFDVVLVQKWILFFPSVVTIVIFVRCDYNENTFNISEDSAQSSLVNLLFNDEQRDNLD